MGAKNILLVEDSEEVQIVVRNTLRKYNLKIVSTASDALKELESSDYCVAILDVGLSDGDGFKMCANLRMEPKHKDLQIIFLTGKSNIEDKVMGFSVGADDYIQKPFDPMELHARVLAKLRRAETDAENHEQFVKGPFKVNAQTQKVYLSENAKERDLQLSPIEFRLLNYFIKHEDHILSRQQILDHVWGTEIYITDRVVDTNVYTLRKKLGAYSNLLKSIPREGYTFSLK